MAFAILVLIIALIVAAIAGWFSIVGLMAIFASSPYSIAVMAAGLEAAKLVTASWLYRNWDDAPGLLKWPLASMTVVLMLITSLGIFGFLSKSHIEQGAPVGTNIAKIERLDKRIIREQKTIDDAQSVVLQLDNAVATLQEYDRIRGPSGSIAVRNDQKEERASLKVTIDESQDEIDVYEDTKAELASKVRAFEVEVGPIKYVADMIYGANAGETALAAAVRWLIMIIIFVFDPLAILLLIAANYSLIEYGLKVHPRDKKRQIQEEKQESVSEEVPEKTFVEETFETLNTLVDKSEQKPHWDEDKADERMNIIAQNGNDGLHYEEEKIEEKPPEVNEVVVIESSPEPESKEVEKVEELAKTDDKVVDNKPRTMSGISGWLLNDNKKES